MIHRLKCWAENFDAIVAGKKTAEARVEEGRVFHVGDQLALLRTDHVGRATQPECQVLVDVTHVDRKAGPLEILGLEENRASSGAHPIAVMSFKPPAGVFSKVPK